MKTPATATPRGARPLTIAELTARVRVLLEGQFDTVWVEGEVSNWSVAGSGHAYFALKDESALLSCVCWRSTVASLKAPMRDGLRVEARGRLSVFDKRGQYQLTVDSIKPTGEGALWQRFLEMKARLEAEGLFEAARKRPIPRLAQRVGIVTSPTGAAIRDILSVLGRRAPNLDILIWPARVQGAGAAAEIARGVQRLGASGLVDVVIVGRGGGSLEDLWEFNEEVVARAIAASPVPVISAVGHEVDFSISDFVADLRAATPSAAAELVSADHAAFGDRVRTAASRLERAVDGRVRDARERLRACLSSYALRQPEARLGDAQQRADEALRRLEDALGSRLRELTHRAQRAVAALAGHDPALILRKGYAIVRRAKDDRLVTDAAALKPGTQVRTQLAGGVFRSVVMKDEADLFE